MLLLMKSILLGVGVCCIAAAFSNIPPWQRGNAKPSSKELALQWLVWGLWVICLG